jgi:hypothetical protein
VRQPTRHTFVVSKFVLQQLQRGFLQQLEERVAKSKAWQGLAVGFREPKNLEPRLWFQVFDPRGLFHLDRKQRRTTMLRSSFRIVNFS